MARITLSVPPSVLDGLRTLAEKRNRSMGAIIREALEEKLGKFRDQPTGSESLNAIEVGDTCGRQ